MSSDDKRTALLHTIAAWREAADAHDKGSPQYKEFQMKMKRAEWELQRHFGVTPPSVHQMVLTLERAGLIRRQPGVPRSIEVLVPPDDLPALQAQTQPDTSKNPIVTGGDDVEKRVLGALRGNSW